MHIDCGYQSARKEGKKMYVLTVKMINRKTHEEMLLLKGKYSSYHECEMIRDRAVSHVNRMRYYTSSKIEREGEDK